MAATGGPPPPPRGFEDSSSNGNTPPDFDLHITTSSSDALVSSQQNLERLHFLSAKNSVELHKKTIERKHSLPSKFQPEDYARLRDAEISITRAPAILNKKPSNGNPRKNVAWADLNVMSVQSEVMGGNVKRNESVETMDVDPQSDYENDRSNQLKLIAKQNRLADDAEHQKVPVEKTQDVQLHLANNALQTIKIAKLQREETDTQNKYAFSDGEAETNIWVNRFDNTNGPGSYTDIPASDVDQSLVNQFDNLALFDAADNRNENKFNSDSKGNSMCGDSGRQSPRKTEITCNQNKPPTGLANNSLSHLTTQERQKYFDEDDEFIEDEEPKLIIPSSSELPTPDPEYVAQICSLEERPLIAKVYKKDCRTWLWKSAKHRTAALAKSSQSEGPSKSKMSG